MVLAEPSRTMTYISRKTVYGLARKQLHLNKAKLCFPILTNRSRVWPVNHLHLHIIYTLVLV